VSPAGDPTVYPHMRTINLTCAGQVNPEAKELLQKQFADQTGWQLILD
jgi:hypothetical protein